MTCFPLFLSKQFRLDSSRLAAGWLIPSPFHGKIKSRGNDWLEEEGDGAVGLFFYHLPALLKELGPPMLDRLETRHLPEDFW